MTIRRLEIMIGLVGTQNDPPRAAGVEVQVETEAEVGIDGEEAEIVTEGTTEIVAGVVETENLTETEAGIGDEVAVEAGIVVEGAATAVGPHLHRNMNGYQRSKSTVVRKRLRHHLC